MDDVAITHSDVHQSWQDHLFSFSLDDPKTKAPSLRKPQLAALYATFDHLVVGSTATTTVVMPTGTGKTDTMLALVIAARMNRTLILVPSDALRTQLVNKCAEMKTLRTVGAVSDTARNPIVTAIDSKMSEAQVAELATANIIVATPQALLLFDEAALGALVKTCSHLMADEAHHVAATNWNWIKTAFRANLVFSSQRRHSGRMVWPWLVRSSTATRSGMRSSWLFQRHRVSYFLRSQRSACLPLNSSPNAVVKQFASSYSVNKYERTSFASS